MMIRSFIVGYPRSGTTLVQSIVAAHSAIFSLPETHFFSRILPTNRFLRRFRLTDRTVREFLDKKLHEIPDSSRFRPSGLKRLVVSTYGIAFANALDKLAQRENRIGWVEKTPQHLRRIQYIEAAIPDARFIHVTRSGEDAISSQYDVTRRFPEQWGGERTLEQCIDRWILEIGISKKYLGDPLHLVVCYEDLIENPQSEALRICAFLQVEYEENMLLRYPDAYRNTVGEAGAVWTENAMRPIGNKGATRKFDSELTRSEQELVQSRLKEANCLDHREFLFG